MDLKQIRAFMCVFEHGSFTAAARKMNVAQPALSVQIRHLEDELGVSLFARRPDGIVPTAAGRRFYELSGPIRSSADHARQQMSEMVAAEPIVGPLRCGFPPSFFKCFLGRILAGFAQRHPAIDLSVSEAYGGTLKDWVIAGDLDFAIGGFDAADGALTGQIFFEERLVLVSGAPVFGPRFQSCDLRTYDDFKLMLPRGHQVLGPMLAQYLANGIIRPSRTMIVDSYLGVLETARASDWVALVPVTGILDEVARDDLHLYPLDEPTLTFRWYLIHARDKPLSAAARLFLDDVAAELEATQRAWSDVLHRA
jgi:LysR family nitrogen assimilation transcriptional regulator